MTTFARNDDTAGKLAAFLVETGLGGVGPMRSAETLADVYLSDSRCRNDDQRVDRLIRLETRRNFVTGFLSGLGGAVTFPVSIPAALAASWLIQARMAGVIARIYGHDLASDQVRTRILLSMAGDVAKEAMQDLGLKVEGRLTQGAVERIPGRVLVEINKRIGTRLLATAGERVVLRFPRAVPVIGGVVGGSLDGVVCRMVGRTAKTLFRPPAGGVLTGEVLR